MQDFFQNGALSSFANESIISLVPNSTWRNGALYSVYCTTPLVWKAKVPAEIKKKNHMWKACHNILLTKSNITKRMISNDSLPNLYRGSGEHRAYVPQLPVGPFCLYWAQGHDVVLLVLWMTKQKTNQIKCQAKFIWTWKTYSLTWKSLWLFWRWISVIGSREMDGIPRVYIIDKEANYLMTRGVVFKKKIPTTSKRRVERDLKEKEKPNHPGNGILSTITCTI